MHTKDKSPKNGFKKYKTDLIPIGESIYYTWAIFINNKY